MSVAQRPAVKKSTAKETPTKKARSVGGHNLKYSMELETAFRGAMGSRAYNSASLFQNPKHLRDYLRDWIQTIRRRVDDVTLHDDRMQQVLINRLTYFDERLKKYPREVHEAEIIADLVKIVNNLLGWDYADGEVLHHVLMYQDADQQRKTASRSGEHKRENELWLWENRDAARRSTANLLRQKGLTTYQIADVMQCSINNVRKLLKEYAAATATKTAENSDGDD